MVGKDSSKEVEQSASWMESSKKRLDSLLSSVSPLEGKILLLSRFQRSASDVSISLLVVEKDRKLAGSEAEPNSDASKSEDESGWLNEIGAVGFNVKSALEKSVSSSSVNHVESEESNIAVDAIIESMNIVLNMSRDNMMKGGKFKSPC